MKAVTWDMPLMNRGGGVGGNGQEGQAVVTSAWDSCPAQGRERGIHACVLDFWLIEPGDKDIERGS